MTNSKNPTPDKPQNAFSFNITRRINDLGRIGLIHTPHGDIKTPAFIAVGTRGYVRFIPPADLHALGAQAMLSNAYHLRNQAAEIAEAGGLASWTPWHSPTFTDSGGFQVMSLGSGLGKVVSMDRKLGVTNTAHKERLARVTDEGVHFADPFTAQPDFIGPEESMRIQCQIGADIHMAFDELTSLADTYEYNQKALIRTEKWAARSLAEHLQHRDDLGYRQSLYGVLQGGRWEDLRRSTAQKLAAMTIDSTGFDGFGLGGAFLKEDLGEILRWCNEELPENKPRHLLGLSHPDDIFLGVEMGADTFDCVAPTREARHGRIYTVNGPIQLRKFAHSIEPLDPAGYIFDHANSEVYPADHILDPIDAAAKTASGSRTIIHSSGFQYSPTAPCDCATCRAGYARGQLRALWRSADPVDLPLPRTDGFNPAAPESERRQKNKQLFYHLASIHNLRFIIRLTEQIRASIIDGTFYDFRAQFLRRYYHHD